MQYLSTNSIQLTVPTEGPLLLSIEQLQQIGFAPGDQLVMFVTQPGQIYIQRVEAQPFSKTVLRRQIQQAFQDNGYDSREKVVRLMREIKQEMADERIY